MDKEIKITAAGPEHLESLIALFNEGFLQKFGYISENREKQRSFTRDFGLINIKAEDKDFVALADGRVLGFISFRFRGQKGILASPPLSLFGMIRRYSLRGVIKAFRLGMTFNYNPPEGELYIDTVGVSAEARGLGIGTRLLEFAEELALKKGLNRLSLKVMFENTRARALYERLGFKVISEEHLPWYEESSGYSGAWFMIRELE